MAVKMFYDELSFMTLISDRQVCLIVSIFLMQNFLSLSDINCSHYLQLQLGGLGLKCFFYL